jgi:serine/threonine protein kinase
MQIQQSPAAICPGCGTRLAGGFSSGLGRCMVCLLRVGFESEDCGPGDEAGLPECDRLGSYRIARRDDGSLWELGRGAMGVTYRALDTSLKRPLALKLINAEWVKRGAEARARFMREARAAAALRHPNVATVYQFGVHEETGQYFCAMELLEGETLEMRVRRAGPLDALTTIEIALQVCSALAAAEKQGVVHRDLKPANLMLIATGSDSDDSSPPIVKVIDFGVAKALADEPDAEGLTHGGFVGTPAFASPEQFSNAPVEIRSDIYSLGATLCYLLTGQMPFGARAAEASREDAQLRALPVERLKAARVPARLISVLGAMLAHAPAARPGVRGLTERLQQARAQLGRRWTGTRRLMFASALVVLASTVAFVLVRQSSDSSRTTIPAPEKSIAVLPFENLSHDQADAYFTDGLHDEVLLNLSRIRDLKMINRGSVVQFRTAKTRNLGEIGRALGVANILEGQVDRVGDKVQVRAQLTDLRRNALLWSETYERASENAFGIQVEIARAVADQLQVTLSPTEERAMQKPPTKDMVAYQLYLNARALYVDNGKGTLPSNLRLPQAVQWLDQAVARDPSFMPAWCMLAGAHAHLYVQGYDHSPARLALAETAIQTAQRLAPEAGKCISRSGFITISPFVITNEHVRSWLRQREHCLIAAKCLKPLGGSIGAKAAGTKQCAIWNAWSRSTPAIRATLSCWPEPTTSSVVTPTKYRLMIVRSPSRQVR